MTFYTWLTSSPHPESFSASAAVRITTVLARRPSAHKHAAIIRVVSMAYNVHPHQKPLVQLSCWGPTVSHQASDLFTLQLERASGVTSRCGVG